MARKRGGGSPRLHPFEHGVLETVRARGLLDPGAAVLVALSGGPDSTSLVAALAALRDAGAGGPVLACHVDHRLRAGSAEDAAFCAALCERLRVPLDRVAVDVGAGNLQAAARRARYAALRAAAQRVGAASIATGHTKSDQAETVLLRLSRGAGARGLAAIPPRRGPLVRPLLDRSRAEVLAYLRDRGLGFREDPSNATDRFDRNRVRHELLPAFERLRPGVEDALARAADLLRDDERALDRLARALAPAGARRAPVAALRAAPRAVRTRAVRRLWAAATGSRRGLEARHVAAILRLLRRPRPGRISLPRGAIARVGAGALELLPPAPGGCPSRRGVL
jgi:tRNA(Ile)-lysidine synthase